MDWSFFSTSSKILFHHELDSSPLLSYDPHPASEINQGILNYNGHIVATAGKDGLVKISHIEKRKELMTLSEQGVVG